MYEIWTKQNFKLKQIEETEQIKNIHLYKRGVYEFELNERPKCKICGSDLKFIKKVQKTPCTLIRAGRKYLSMFLVIQ